MHLNLLPNILAVVRMEPTEPIPEWSKTGTFCSITITEREMSIFCDNNLIPEEIKRVDGWRAFQVDGQLNFELSGRALFSDYLDDVSTVYPNKVELQALRGDMAAMLTDRSGEVVAEPIGGEGRQRGTSSTNDAYAFFSVGLVYYIGTLPCPPISRPR